MLPVAIFFGVGFIVIVVTTNLVLADYALRFGNFMLVVAAALIVGKAVLVANATPFLRRYDTMPLAWTIIYKASVYCVFVFAARVIELNVEGWLGGTPFAEFLATFSWHRFLAIQIWLFVLFLVYVTFHELSQLLGEGELKQVCSGAAHRIWRWAAGADAGSGATGSSDGKPHAGGTGRPRVAGQCRTDPTAARTGKGGGSGLNGDAPGGARRHGPAPQRYCIKMPTSPWLLLVRAETPVLSKSLSE